MRLNSWFDAVSTRASTLMTTPEPRSLVQLPPYLRPVFNAHKLSVEQQKDIIHAAEFSNLDNEAGFSALIKTGVGMKAAEKKERQQQQRSLRGEISKL